MPQVVSKLNGKLVQENPLTEAAQGGGSGMRAIVRDSVVVREALTSITGS